MTHAHAQFAGSVPAAYDRYLGPFLFEPYARDFVARTAWGDRRDVLELAAGTGILTRHLRAALPASARLVATDLNPDMLAIARQKHPDLAVTWEPADALALPYPDASVDAVACQYGLMFFPDKPAALRELRRVLRAGGLLALSVWESLDQNPLLALAKAHVNRYFASDPPTFFDTPFGFGDQPQLRRWLGDAGFAVQAMDVVALTVESPTARDAATGAVTGNPTVVAIRERATAPEQEIITTLEREIAARFGAAPCRVPMSAVMVVATAA